MSTTLAAPLSPPLGPREAITDALYRCVVGLDTNDKALFLSAFTSDASFALNENVMTGLPDIETGIYDMIAKMDTTHFVTNVRINIDSASGIAHLTASALAQHYHGGKAFEPDSTNYLAGSLYWGDLIEDKAEGLWKFTSWRMKVQWGQGDQGVFAK